MSPSYPDYLIYNDFLLRKYFATLPLWRRIFARFSEKYKVTKEEYDKWWWKNFN